MKRFPIVVPADLGDRGVARFLERTCRKAGLKISLQGTLRSIPGSLHWHFKQPRGPGVLELTYLPSGRRAWLSVHENRRAPWINPAIIQIRQMLSP